MRGFVHSVNVFGLGLSDAETDRGLAYLEWKPRSATSISTPLKLPTFPLCRTDFGDLRFHSMYRFLTARGHVPYF